MLVTMIVFILVFSIVVISHELGHFLIAKLNGIRVLEFAIEIYQRGNKVCTAAAADWRRLYV